MYKLKQSGIALLFCLFTLTVSAQTKKVLFEELSGARCGYCPIGAYRLDSILNLYPDLIGVSLHTYSIEDAMYFSDIAVIANSYGVGSPLGITDRFFWGTEVAEETALWNQHVQTRLAVQPKLTVSVNAGWNPGTRSITAQITTTMLTDLTAGDYRISLYVVEDSVTGSGNGYDQANNYNTTSGSPFYNLGNPIQNYVHRHVVRAVLPQPWGLSGILPSTPLSGQTYNTTMNYTLPQNYNSNHIKLVAFVYKFTSNHHGDEVLNAEETDLSLVTNTFETSNLNRITVFPNPAMNQISITSGLENIVLNIYSPEGSRLITKQVKETVYTADISLLSPGAYILELVSGTTSMRTKFIKLL